jgi:hypothetical protein
MFETKTLAAPVESIPQDLIPVLLSLSEAGWKPAILESERVFMKLAGVADKMDLQALHQRRHPFIRHFLAGDVFFKESDVYYLVISTAEYAMIDGAISRVVQSSREREKPSLEIGVVSSGPSDIDERLKLFADSVEQALRSALAGQTDGQSAFDWNEIKPGTPHLDRITTVDQGESGAKFVRAELSPECVQAAHALAPKLNRELLIELLKTGFVREQDVLSRKTKHQQRTKQALQALKDQGLIQTEFLLECRSTRTPLTRLGDPKQLQEAGVAELICPSCGSKFSEEVLSEGYSASELGQQMARHSHWMTVWTTEPLVNLGIPEGAILWNISENGEEVDLLVEFLGQLWIFELKDREFGAGDAHPLNYRQVRYEATKAVIFTTEKVSRDAKRVFEELQREVARSRVVRHSRLPVYIEGLDNAEETLRREIADVSLGYAHGRLAMIGESSGYDLGAVLSARFGAPMDVQEGMEEEIRF